MKLYKYRSIKDKGRLLDIFENNRLYFSQPSQLNDPFECKPIVTIVDDAREIESYVEYLTKKLGGDLDGKEMDRMRNEAKERLSSPKLRAETYYQLVESYGIQCFCSYSNNLLLWAHYADNHRGICFEFDTCCRQPEGA